MPGPGVGGWGCGGVPTPGGVPGPGGCLLPGGGVPGLGGLLPGGVPAPSGDPQGWLLLRTVRILLECILVAQKSTQIGSELRSTAKTGTFTGSCKIIRRRGGVCPKMVQ